MFDLNKEIDEIRLQYYISNNAAGGLIEFSLSDIAKLLNISKSKAQRLIDKFIKLSILEVKDATVEEVNTLVNEINKEIEDETSNPGNGNNGSNDENQGGNNSNGGNTSNNNGSQDENNSNTTKPSNPQTGDASILGFVGVGIASIAGIFANNRRRKK